ncbi:transcriptional regulator [Nocardioides sp. CF8]|uniref:sigma-54-dependent Fis family transcriptional regulator n=1 Tax=Nocardioides sp. CF8 TaxID=110319 RepID=UPI0003307023|nr:helix-turn-helix domain-containing protein [Nocardioides sp. CF8]EON21981.1 transcriptional regulator [Nocardioides sp. CF8]
MDDSGERLRIAAARADFLERPDIETAGVPDFVAASWRRSRSAGVQADTYTVPFHQDIDFDTRLSRCASPVLDRLTADMSDVPVSIALADAKARIIERRDCSTAVGRVLDRVDFNPGFSFEEDGVGTNGIGTVFEAGLAVSVVGSAHFNEALTPFACTGAPVLDPLTGRLEGVLDVSLLAETWNPLIHVLVKTAAGDIGSNLMLDRSRALQALFEAYVKADARTHHAVVAVGDTVILNQRAQHLLSPEDQLVVQEHARFLMARASVRTDLVNLPGGRTLHLRVARVEVGDDTSGVVLLVSDVRHPHHRQSQSGRQGPDALGSLTDDLPEHRAAAFEEPWMSTSKSAAWNRALRSIWEAMQEANPILLTGEAGSGRLRLLTDVFSKCSPGGHVVVVDHVDDVTTLPEGRGLLVLRDIDVMDSAAVRDLAAALPSLADSYLLAATAVGPIASSHAASGLMDHLRCSITVPPLRHRAADVPRLAADVLTELAPGRRVQISPHAQRVLAAYSWPENVPQLRSALGKALLRRPVGEIQAEDLPGYCHTTSQRQLTALEFAERDTILATLTNVGGNRVQAASTLGMARSSLYRKLKYYGITEL